MDGKLNCSMTAENAAFTKIRHLENRVVETETRLDVLEQETTQLDEALQNAIENLQETVVTENVDTGLLRADSIGTALLTADDIDVKDVTATTIEAETIDVDNLQNVNALHGKTVDVEKTIATIGQFTETQTTTANNSTTNTTELNVDGETNLTGQVNIDGNMTFTKDNGLSKLQGNYLEIDAAKVVIDNKNNDEYALYVPGVNGDALFGGSVAVQDTLATKNLAVTGETYFKDGFTLDSLTLKNITDGGYSTTALDVDSKGKVVKVKLAPDIPGAAEMLEANVTRYISELNPILQRAEDDTSNFVIQVDTNTFLPMVYDRTTDETTVTIPNGDTADPHLTCSHLDNIYYVKGSEYLKYNITTGTTTVVAQIDESKTYITMSIIFGKVLNEDIPAYYCANDNKMYSLLDGSELEVSFTVSSDEEVLTVYADKNGKTYKGILSTDTSFNSILDEGQGVLFEVPGMPDGDGKGYAVNCPAGIINTDNGRMGPINGGQQVDVGEDEVFFYRLAKDGTYVFGIMGYIYTYNEGDSYPVMHYSRVYNYGYFAGFDYFTNTPYTNKLLEVSAENVFVAKDIPVEINGKYFVDGRWYDKVVTNTRELLDYILDTTNKDANKIYSILFTGNKIHFDASVLPEEAIQADQVIGTYKVYHDTEDNVKELSFLDNNYEPYGEYEPLAYFKELLDKVHFYGFKTELDVISNEGLAAEYSKCLHINNCYFNYSENYYTNTVAFRLILKNCNNVEIGSNLKWNSTAVLNLEQCNGIYATNFGMGKSDATNVEILMVHSNNCCVEIPSAVVGTVTYTQGGPGDNLVVHYKVADDGTKIDPTYTKYW